jgi:chromate reductase, NAD(P)H dehydrogenase (quinone)
MSKNILVFGASNSRNSINKKLALYASSQIKNSEINLVDLNDFEMPIFSVDMERENGIPRQAHKFGEYINKSDGIIISLAEHNGNYTAAFKNILDWVSRIESSVWKNKPMFLMGTSPGGRGAKTVLGIALKEFPFRGAKVVASFSLPSFHTNFSKEDGITDDELSKIFKDQLNLFVKALND